MICYEYIWAFWHVVKAMSNNCHFSTIQRRLVDYGSVKGGQERIGSDLVGLKASVRPDIMMVGKLQNAL